jgi:predicted SprT family Zn-dependent metalloprotease
MSTVATLLEEINAKPEQYQVAAVADLLALPVRWNGRLQSSAGRCCLVHFRSARIVQVRCIELNPKLRQEGEDALSATFLHELAHAVAAVRHGAQGRGHGVAWKRAMRDLGQPAERFHSYESMQRRKPSASRVVARCVRCGVEVRRRRALPRNRSYTHTGCGGEVVTV